MTELDAWVGRSETRHDVVEAQRVAALAATLDHPRWPVAGDELPPLWHWIGFHDVVPMSGLGPDGHARRGGFLPPVPLPRRMWAGGRVEFHAPLVIGEPITRTSTVLSITPKHGRSGEMVFVVVRHAITAADGSVRLVEEHDIVYREMPPADAPPPAAQPAPTDAGFSREVHPDPVLLFRYSALTFNGHRIHYDRDFCREHEGYPGLVVHGPLTATLLLDLLAAEHPRRRPARLAYRAVSPLFDTAPYTVNGRLEGDGCRLWASNSTGGLAMDASIVFTPAQSTANRSRP